MEIGLVGLANVGKSTLFNALTQASAKVSLYPFCTIEPNEGIVPIPDERLQKLSAIFHQETVIPATVRFVDIAGLVRGASKGEGLGNQFLAHIRQVDAIVHLIRYFKDINVPHVEGNVDPLRDIEIVNIELSLADLATVEKRWETTKKKAKAGEKEYLAELQLLEKLKETLNSGLPARKLELEEREKEIVKDLHLLTDKPVIYVPNIDESDLSKREEIIEELKDLVGDNEIIPICAKAEAELAQLPPEEAQEFRQELELDRSGLDKLIRASYKMLNLITFFTGVGKELRAWTVPKGTRAQKAAGKIHSDMERGFIRAEVISYEKLLEAGSWTRAHQLGLIRSEGKDYIIEEGEVVYIRFA